MRTFKAAGRSRGAIVGLSLLAWSGDKACAGTIPAGKVSTPMGAPNFKEITILPNPMPPAPPTYDGNGDGAFKTQAPVQLSFNVNDQSTGTNVPGSNTSTNYTITETILNLDVHALTWDDFHMKLSGDVPVTFVTPPAPSGPPGSIPLVTPDKTSITFIDMDVVPSESATFTFILNVPNIPPGKNGSFQLTEFDSVSSIPEPSTLVISGIGITILMGCILYRDGKRVQAEVKSRCQLSFLETEN
jgi:hypothetical protein